jgi:hypothetical protein
LLVIVENGVLIFQGLMSVSSENLQKRSAIKLDCG